MNNPFTLQGSEGEDSDYISWFQLAHHPLELVEIEAAVAVDVVGPDHGLAVCDGAFVAELGEHPLQAPGGDPARGLHGVEHLERPPQVLLLAALPLHQRHEPGEVQHVAAVAARWRHVVAHGHEEGAQLGAGDLAVVVPVEVLEDPLQLRVPTAGAGVGPGTPTERRRRRPRDGRATRAGNVRLPAH